MTGVDIIGSILRADAALLTKVPAAQIKAGALPEDAPLPSILVRSISELERLKLRRTGMIRIIERVEAVSRAGSYRDLSAIRKLVRDTCAGFVGSIAGGQNISVTNAGAGPDMDGPNNSFERGQDFRVSYEIPA